MWEPERNPQLQIDVRWTDTTSVPESTLIQCNVLVKGISVRKLIFAALCTAAVAGPRPMETASGQTENVLPKTALPDTQLSLERRTHPGTFFDVLGRRAGVFAYEHRGIEAWVYPLKILEDFRLSFSLEGYPLAVPAEDLLASISARPEATTLTYSHAAFRVRQILFVPIDQPAVVMLLDVQTTLPMRITASFRPR